VAFKTEALGVEFKLMSKSPKTLHYPLDYVRLENTTKSNCRPELCL
jgi:hypothetical protein